MPKPRKIIALERKFLAIQSTRNGNISKICEGLGISRSTFYRLKKRFKSEGLRGLIPKKRNPKMPNRFSIKIENMIIKISMAFPAYSSRRIHEKLLEIDLNLSPSGIYKVWKRYNLTKINQRIYRSQNSAVEIFT